MAIERLLKIAIIHLILFLNVVLALAIFGYFEKSIVWGLAVFFALSFISYLVYRVVVKKDRPKLNKFEITVLVIIALIAIFNGLLHHDIPRGRDDMGYLSAAIMINDSGSLAFEDPISHPYHPFRNIEGDKFTSQFLPAYNAYLGSLYAVGGLALMLWANAILLFFSLIAIYYFTKNLLDSKAGFIAVILFSSLYVTNWFARRVNSEGLLMLLIFAALWLVTVGWKKKKLSWIVASLPIVSLSILARGEALAYLAATLMVVLMAIYHFRSQFVTTLKVIIPSFLITAFNLFLFKSYADLYGADYIEYTFKHAGSALRMFSGINLVLVGAILLIVVAGVLLLYRIYRQSSKLRLFFQDNFGHSDKHQRNLRELFLGLLFLFLAGWEAYTLYWINNRGVFTLTFYKTQYVIENFYFCSFVII